MHWFKVGLEGIEIGNIIVIRIAKHTFLLPKPLNMERTPEDLFSIAYILPLSVCLDSSPFCHISWVFLLRFIRTESFQPPSLIPLCHQTFKNLNAHTFSFEHLILITITHLYSDSSKRLIKCTSWVDWNGFQGLAEYKQIQTKEGVYVTYVSQTKEYMSQGDSHPIWWPIQWRN